MLSKEALPNYTKLLREAVGYCPAVRKVLYQFDGKVYNKRFDDAIREATNHKAYVYRNSYNRDWIDIYFNNPFGYGNCTLLSFKLSELPEGKRIDAYELSKKLNEKRESILKNAYAIESAIEEAPETLERLQNLIDLINQIVQPLPSEFVDAYSLSKISSLKYVRF